MLKTWATGPEQGESPGLSFLSVSEFESAVQPRLTSSSQFSHLSLQVLGLKAVGTMPCSSKHMQIEK